MIPANEFTNYTDNDERSRVRFYTEKERQIPLAESPAQSHSRGKTDWRVQSGKSYHDNVIKMETISALLALSAGNSPVTGEFPAQRPMTRSVDVFLDLRLE